MKVEDLFVYGITPKEGPYAGKKFIVSEITPTVVKATLCDGDKARADEFTHGSYDIWKEPKTMFEDRQIPSTVGNLKKAIAAAGLDDDTELVMNCSFWGFSLQDVSAKIVEIDGKKAILFY